MAKISSGKLHQSYDSSMGFGIAIGDMISRIRSDMPSIPKFKRADLITTGTLHALAKVMKGEPKSAFMSKLYKPEVEEWQATLNAWFKRVRLKYTPEAAEQFQKNLDADFQTLLKNAKDKDERYWRAESRETFLKIRFKTHEEKEAAEDAAERLHPVKLGHALSKYLERCISDLHGDTPASPSPAPNGEPWEPLRLSLGWSTDEEDVDDHSESTHLTTDSFARFAIDPDGDTEITAYDIEDAVINYLKKHDRSLLKTLDFDCESSLFWVGSTEPSSLATVAEILLRFSRDLQLFESYWKPKKKK